jgi:integrase
VKGHVEKKRGRYYVVIELDRDPETGRRRRKWTGGFARKKDADAALAEAVYKRQEGTYVSPSKRTLEEFLEEWLRGIRPTIRPSTWESYNWIIHNRVLPFLGGTPLQRVTPPVLNAHYAHLLEAGRANGTGLSPRSVRLVHVVLHRALRDAVRWGMLGRNAADQADPPRVPKRELHTWNGEQAATFLRRAREHRLYPAFLLLLGTGMRRGEVCGLRWGDGVDLARGLVSVKRNRVVVRYSNVVEGEPKTSRGRRSIPLDPAIVAALRSHRTAQLEERLSAGAQYSDSGLVFTREDGAPLHPETLSKAFVALVAQAELPRIPLRDCRHSFATISLATGTPLWAVADLLGHSSISITDSFYRDAVPSAMSEAAGKVAAVLLGHSPEQA